jgi:hypothetical protein
MSVQDTQIKTSDEGHRRSLVRERTLQDVITDMGPEGTRHQDCLSRYLQ